MARKASDEICLENVEKMKSLFSKVIDDASRFRVVYGCGVDVGMMDFIVLRKSTYTYSSYAIGFDEIQNEIIILPINRDFSSYGTPIYVKKNEVKKAKISMFSKEIKIQSDKFPKKYITFTVQEKLNDDPEEVAVCVMQENEAKAFINFFKNKFS